jgi:hypothetical protein
MFPIVHSVDLGGVEKDFQFLPTGQAPIGLHRYGDQARDAIIGVISSSATNEYVHLS